MSADQDTYARIAFVGDVMLGRLVSGELHHRAPESFWGDVRPLLQSCDAVIANLECAITLHEGRWIRTPKVFHFGADPLAVEVLKAGNIRCVNLANNHVLDFETAGLDDTLKHLDAAHIVHAGAGPDDSAARQPAWLSAGALKLALFGCVDHEKPFAAGPRRPGTAFVDPEQNGAAAFPDKTSIDKARSAGADIVALSCHFGPNMVLRPSEAIAQYRRAATARGVDIVHGHSAHLFEGVERCGRSLILHDTGDFLDDYAIDPELHNDWSFVFVVETAKTGLKKLSLYPVFLEFAQLRLATEKEAALMFERMARLSAEFGTQLTKSHDGLALELGLDGPQNP